MPDDLLFLFSLHRFVSSRQLNWLLKKVNMVDSVGGSHAEERYFAETVNGRVLCQTIYYFYFICTENKKTPSRPMQSCSGGSAKLDWLQRCRDPGSSSLVEQWISISLITGGCGTFISFVLIIIILSFV